MKGYTTTETLPPDVQELYELTSPIQGGPVFDLPSVRQYGIDFSKITLDQADVLLKRKWKGIRLKTVQPRTVVTDGDDILETSAPPHRTRPRKAADDTGE